MGGVRRRIMSEITYVYDGQEVKKTGRMARKKRRKSALAKKTGSSPTVVEIECLPDPNVDTQPWKKWVREDELYEIEGPDLIHLVSERGGLNGELLIKRIWLSCVQSEVSR